MTWLIAVDFLKRHGALVLAAVLLIWVSAEFIDRGNDIERLEAKNAAITAQLDTYKANAANIEDVRREVVVCLERVDAVQAESNDWQRRYNEMERKPARVIRVPVEVAAPGTPCGEATAEIAEWLAGEIAP